MIKVDTMRICSSGIWVKEQLYLGKCSFSEAAFIFQEDQQRIKAVKRSINTSFAIKKG
jgi:hypothetical protein